MLEEDEDPRPAEHSPGFSSPIVWLVADSELLQTSFQAMVDEGLPKTIATR